MDHTAIKQLQDTAVALAANNEIADKVNMPAVVLPDQHHVIDLEHLMDRPSRFRAEYETEHMPSFVAYCNAKSAESPFMCLVDPPTMTAQIIFDLGDPGSPGHGEHQAVLNLRSSADYVAFLSLTGYDRMDQRTLAEFIEDYPDNLTAYNEQHQQIHLGKVVSTVRDVEIKASSTRKSTEQDFSTAKSLLEQIDAKGADGAFPALMKFTCQPYAELPEHDFYFRIRVRTSDTLSFRAVRVKPEQDDEIIAHGFVAELSGQLDAPVLQGLWKR